MLIPFLALVMSNTNTGAATFVWRWPNNLLSGAYIADMYIFWQRPPDTLLYSLEGAAELWFQRQ